VQLARGIVGVFFGDRVVGTDHFEGFAVAGGPTQPSLSEPEGSRAVRQGGSIPGVRNNDVVEGLVGAPEAGEADLDNHLAFCFCLCAGRGEGDSVDLLPANEAKQMMLGRRRALSVVFVAVVCCDPSLASKRAGPSGAAEILNRWPVSQSACLHPVLAECLVSACVNPTSGPHLERVRQVR